MSFEVLTFHKINYRNINSTESDPCYCTFFSITAVSLAHICRILVVFHNKVVSIFLVVNKFGFLAFLAINQSRPTTLCNFNCTSPCVTAVVIFNGYGQAFVTFETITKHFKVFWEFNNGLFNTVDCIAQISIIVASTTSSNRNTQICKIWVI